MGNIVSENQNKYDNSQLKKIITTWALDNYDAGLNYDNQQNITNLLQKRACCTNNVNVNIAFPIINITDTNNMQPGYYPVNIQVFTGNNPTEGQCELDISPQNVNKQYGNTDMPNYLQKNITQGNPLNDLCTAIYTVEKYMEKSIRKIKM